MLGALCFFVSSAQQCSPIAIYQSPYSQSPKPLPSPARTRVASRTAKIAHDGMLDYLDYNG
jgi:hypothetical protein